MPPSSYTALKSKPNTPTPSLPAPFPPPSLSFSIPPPPPPLQLLPQFPLNTPYSADPTVDQSRIDLRDGGAGGQDFEGLGACGDAAGGEDDFSFGGWGRVGGGGEVCLGWGGLG